jgi:enterochelin esterase-like enzyme
MSDRYARFIQTEVLPAVVANAQVKASYPNFSFTDNPEGRAALGCSSGSQAALVMGWFRPDLFRRLITYSGSFDDEQNHKAPEAAMFPLGGWEFHSELQLIANTLQKPIRPNPLAPKRRPFLNANEADNGATQPASEHGNTLLANQLTAAALKAKGYHYRYVFGKGASHCQDNVQSATLADALVWTWRGYPAP